MAEQDKKPKMEKRARRFRWWAVVVMFAAPGLLGMLCIVSFRSVEEQLAATNAARGVPDEENAATIYSELADHHEAVELGTFTLTIHPATSLTFQFWSSEDHPEAVEWLQRHHAVISILKQASMKNKCWFGISVDPIVLRQHKNVIAAINFGTDLLIAAGNNDVAEGRIDAGLEKYLCVLQIARHLRQQLLVRDLGAGLALEAVALQSISRFVVEGPPQKTHLDIIEQALPTTKYNWDRDWQEVRHLQRLLEFRDRQRLLEWECFDPLTWLELEPSSYDFARWESEMHEFYDRALAHRRATRIVVALRRYRHVEGRWPQMLDDVKALAPDEMFVDPLNAGDFVYQVTDENFRLYSKGRNNIDEGGRRESGANDWPIWPPEW